jgi:hypothetical protein
MRKYFVPLFNPETSVVMTVCGPSQTKEISDGFMEAGYEVEIRHKDDKVPWANENSLSAKTLKLIGQIFIASESVVQRSRRLLSVS